MTAEAYACVENKITPICETSGPGGTHAVTGVSGAISKIMSGLSLGAVGNRKFGIACVAECTSPNMPR